MFPVGRRILAYSLLLACLLLIVQHSNIQVALLKNRSLLELMRIWPAPDFSRTDLPCEGEALLPDMENSLSGILSAKPGDIRVSTHLGRVYWIEGRCDDALAIWRATASAGEPTAAYELFLRGQYDYLPHQSRRSLADMSYISALQLVLDEEYELAERWTGRAIELMPQREALLRLAYWYDKAGEVSSAKRLWQQMANAYQTSDPEHWFATAKAHEQESEWQSAAEAYTSGASLSAEPTEFWILAGNAWERVSASDAAIRAYEQAEYAGSPSVAARLSLSNVYRAIGQYDESIKWAGLAQQIEPDSFVPYHYLGLAYNSAGDYAAARLHFEKALELSPEEPWVSYQLARVWYYGLQQPSKAESILAQAIRYHSEPPASWWLELGDWRLVLDRCEAAEKAYAAARSAGADAEILRTTLTHFDSICGQD